MAPRPGAGLVDSGATGTKVARFAKVAIEGHTISLTSLDRVYWPAQGIEHRDITKHDFLAYLAQVAPSMLPHLRNRPLTLFRWPDGIGARRVLQKHWEIALPPFVERASVFSQTKGHDDEYILCNNLATLIWLGEMGTLEIHGWHSRVRPASESPEARDEAAGSAERLRAARVDYPDYVLFDLDPFIYAGNEAAGDEPELNATAFEKARQVAFWLKALLDAMSIRSWVKTSGKTGLHVVVPIEPALRFDAVRSMAQFIGQHLLKAHPKDITMDWSVPRRAGKVFLDYNMNVRGKSMTAPYSPRGLAGAPVSMPLAWRELAQAHPMDYRITTTAALLAKHGDRWKQVPATAQDLQAILSASKSSSG